MKFLDISALQNKYITNLYFCSVEISKCYYAFTEKAKLPKGIKEKKSIVSTTSQSKPVWPFLLWKTKTWYFYLQKCILSCSIFSFEANCSKCMSFPAIFILLHICQKIHLERDADQNPTTNTRMLLPQKRQRAKLMLHNMQHPITCRLNDSTQ